MTKIILYGAGGHAAVVADLIFDTGFYEIAEVTDDAHERQGQMAFGKLVVRDPKFLLDPEFRTMPIVIGIGDNEVRARVVSSLGYREFPALIHSTAVIGTDVELGEGTVVMPRAIVEPGTRIGAHCIINNGAVIGHGSTLGDYTHVSGNAVLGGGVRLGERCLVGINASALPGVEIGPDSIVSAGAVAARVIPPHHSVMHSSSRVIRRYAKHHETT